jgi:peroxiredoxin
VHEALVKKGGRLLAISVEPPALSRRIVEEQRLPFAILSDAGASVVRAYGLLHPQGAPDGTDMAIPAHVLVSPDGGIMWRSVSERAQDRLDPREVLAAVLRS